MDNEAHPLGRWLNQEAGATLVETVISIGLLSATILVIISAVTMHSISTRSLDQIDVSNNLVKTQLEDIKNSTYQLVSYPVTVTPPAGYAVSISVVVQNPPTNTLQLVTVTVTRGSNTLVSVQIYKAKLS